VRLSAQLIPGRFAVKRSEVNLTIPISDNAAGDPTITNPMDIDEDIKQNNQFKIHIKEKI